MELRGISTASNANNEGFSIEKENKEWTYICSVPITCQHVQSPDLVPGSVLNISHIHNPHNSQGTGGEEGTGVWWGASYYLHFADEETESRR